MGLVAAFLAATAFYQSVSDFSKAFESNPKSPEAAFNFALALLNDQRPAEALTVLDRLPTPHADLLTLRGAVLNAMGRADEAADALRRAVILNPNNTDTLYDLALTLLKTDSVPEAADLLARSRRRFPRAANIHAASGMTAYRMGKYEDSIRWYEIAVKLEPKAADFHASLGDVYDATGELAKANAAYARAVRLEPSSSDYHVKHGRNLLKLQRTREAQSAFEQALKHNPSAADAHFQLGKLAASASDFKTATSHLEQAVALNSALKEAWYQLSLSYRRLGQEEKSRSAMEQSRKLP